MGLAILDNAIEILREAGFPTQRAYPGTEIPDITKAVAAVRLARMDLDTRETVLEVMLLCPQKLGAQAAEDAALTAAEALKDIDLSCEIGSVSFDGRSGFFCISCMATKPQKKRVFLEVPFKIGAVNQNRVVSFTAQQQTNDTVALLKDAPWTVRLEQFTPNAYGEDQDPDGDEFTLTHGVEIYHGCKWTSCKRIRELDGLRQIREGTAMYRTIV